MPHDSMKLEEIARLVHQGWCEYKASVGFIYGPDRSDSTHPHLVGWEAFDIDSQNQDRFIASMVLRAWNLGILSPSDLPMAIHNAWSLSIHATNRSHPHAVPFNEARKSDLAEHQVQADLIASYLANHTAGEQHSEYDRKCLVLLPFRPHTMKVYDDVVSPAIRRSGYLPVRADLLRGPQSIHDEVIDQIALATSIVADLTDDNPNVNYEIGIARSLGKPIIMISSARDPASVPFYYKGQRIHFYDASEAGWKERLTQYVELTLQGAHRLDPLRENQKIGLTGLFGSDDSSFETELKRQIAITKKRVVAVGWGLAFINRQRREVMDVLRQQVLTEPDLTVHIILARPDHPGLIQRIQEEREQQPNTGILADWQSEFIKFARELPNSLSGTDKERVFVRHVRFLPTAMVVQLDDVFFVRVYGPPNTGGWQSPWFRCQRSLASDLWVHFLDNFVNQAVLHSFEPKVE